MFQRATYQIASLRVCLALCGVLLISTISALAENVQKRATGLLARAADASSYKVGQQPSFHETVHFVAHGVGGEVDGQYSRDFADPKEQREELVSGNFRELWVWKNGQIWNKKEGEFDASMIARLRTSLPPNRGLELSPFDTVKKIENRDINGAKAQCISFERAFPQKQIANTVCIEQESGVLLLWSRGGLTTEYSEYVPFASKLLPHRVVISENQVKLLDAKINFVAVSEFGANTFVPPPDAHAGTTVQVCTQIERPRLKTQYSPSYPTGARTRGAAGVVNVFAEIGKDGHVRNAHVAQPGDSELDAAAIDAVQRWVYEPATCNGSPVAIQTRIAVNFPH